MENKKKLSIAELQVQSFVTSLPKEIQAELQGATGGGFSCNMTDDCHQTCIQYPSECCASGGQTICGYSCDWG